METISKLIKKGKTFTSDGAWGTLLHDKGLKPGECPELWNITHSDSVFEIAKSYIDAGADMIETNTFGGSRFKLEHYGLGDQTFELNKAGAKISRKAAGNNHYVLGSIGPTGKILMMGEVTEDEMYHSFREQAEGLEKGGSDAIIIETMADLNEALLAIKASKEHTDCEVFCTMTFEKAGPNKYRTMMGVSPEEMVNHLVDAGVDLIGANCGNGIKDMVGVVREIRIHNDSIPILIHANAGMPVYSDGKTIFPETPDEMAGFINEILDAGANIIGGCCGTTPDHIRKISETIKSHL